MTQIDFAIEPIRDTQRRAIFAAARARGMSIDDVRDLSPGGSISALTRAQAGDVLRRLNSGTRYEHPRPAVRGRRRPKNVYRLATPAQRGKIEALRTELDWTPEKLAQWLSERRHGDGRLMSRIDSSSDASAVIELLKGVTIRDQQCRRRREAQAPTGIAAGS